MMVKKRICWISSPAFLDTDIHIVPLLTDSFDIDWYIFRSEKECMDFPKELDALANTLNIKIMITGKRNRSIETLRMYVKNLRAIAKCGYDAIYTAVANFPYFVPSVATLLDRNKVIMAVHNVHVPEGGTHYFFSKLYTAYTLHAFNFYQTFSESQKVELLKKAPQKRVEYIPFLLKDYGIAKEPSRNKSVITFLNFGYIRDYKRIDVLIQAAEKAYEITKKKFKVIIAGSCENWQKYAQMISYDFLFDLRIRRIENGEIPDLFAESDYFVAPYQDIAQSGSLMVAINYEKPIIASRLSAFEENVEDGRTGLLIDPASVTDLTKKIVYVLENHERIYPMYKSSIAKQKQEQFSRTAIAKKYIDYFNEVCS